MEHRQWHETEVLYHGNHQASGKETRSATKHRQRRRTWGLSQNATEGGRDSTPLGPCHTAQERPVSYGHARPRLHWIVLTWRHSLGLVDDGHGGGERRQGL